MYSIMKASRRNLTHRRRQKRAVSRRRRHNQSVKRMRGGVYIYDIGGNKTLDALIKLDPSLLDDFNAILSEQCTGLLYDDQGTVTDSNTYTENTVKNSVIKRMKVLNEPEIKLSILKPTERPSNSFIDNCMSDSYIIFLEKHKQKIISSATDEYGNIHDDINPYIDNQNYIKLKNIINPPKSMLSTLKGKLGF